MLKIVFTVIAIAVIIFVVMRTSSNKKAAVENIQLGIDYLSSNKLEDGVKTTSSGLQYKVLTTGTGTTHPTKSDKVKVHYHGTLTDGTVFDSSVARGEPISFGLNQVIKGWTEGLQLMVVGEKTRLFIPSDLGYGNSASGSIPAGSTLIFDVELLGINE